MKFSKISTIVILANFIFSSLAMALNLSPQEPTPGQKFYSYCKQKSDSYQGSQMTLQDAEFLLKIAKESAADHLTQMRWHGGSEFMDELFQDEMFFQGLHLCYPESSDTRLNFVYLMFAADLLAKQGSEVAITVTGVKFFQYIKATYGARTTQVVGNVLNALAGIGIGASVYGLCQKYLNKKFPLKEIQDLDLSERIKAGMSQNLADIEKLKKYHEQFPDDEMISSELENQKKLYQDSLTLIGNSRPAEKHSSQECLQDLYQQILK